MAIEQHRRRFSIGEYEQMIEAGGGCYLHRQRGIQADHRRKREQLQAKDVDKDTKRRGINKDEIKERLGRSPDFADMVMMRMYFEVKKIPEPGDGYYEEKSYV